MDPVETLKMARDRLKKGEWIQGTSFRLLAPGVYGYCAFGVVRSCVEGKIGDRESYDHLQYCVRELSQDAKRVCPDSLDIVDYNDEFATSKEDILKIFNSTIKRLERRGS